MAGTLSESFIQAAQAVQQACLPAVWSRGVALAREKAVFLDSAEDAGELSLRVRVPNRPVSPKVTLWPPEEGDEGEADWHCDCGDRNDPCMHVAAAAAALRNGWAQSAEKTTGDSDAEVSGTRAGASEVDYRFKRREGALALERWIRWKGGEQRLQTSLVSFSGGIDSGRIAVPRLAATRDDFAVDQILGAGGNELPDRATLPRLLSALKGFPRLTLDGEPVRAMGDALRASALVVDEAGGFRLKRAPEPRAKEIFRNGAVLWDAGEGVALRAVHDPGLSEEERSWLSGEGTFFSLKDSARLVSELLPRLEARLEVRVETRRLPRAIRSAPRIAFQLEELGAEGLAATPRVVYGDPVLGEVRFDGPAGGRLELSKLAQERGEAPLRDLEAERALVERLRLEVQLRPDQPIRLEGAEALAFTRKIGKFTDSSAGAVSGGGARAFRDEGRLEPRVSVSDGGMQLAFRVPGANSEEGARAAAADPERVIRAWRQNESYVPLLDGGWAELPRDWLDRYGERILRFLKLREAKKPIPPCFAREVSELCQAGGGRAPETMLALARALESLGASNASGGAGADPAPLRPAELPSDLRAELRAYQRKGVDWLAFHRDAGMGALLADDMGLGKTLQALCAIRGRALVVCPTSVLHSWVEQARRFRPGLRVAVYHGAARRLDPGASLTVTSYGALRSDLSALARERWDTILLDEAQTIKNPESQVARAAHALQGGFRVALTGTPVENRLDDLWSQFEFLNPGWLGDRDEFREEYASPIARGDTEAARRLRERVRPFLLRRLKKEVAPELPPRTEVTLACELSVSEREIYETLLASVREEVIGKLAAGEGIFAALELLLRLRQAACHPGLLPAGLAAGEGAEGAAGGEPRGSSKLELLVEKLGESIEAGHRALVFSQWTSFLDLAGARLEREGIRFSRLDGSTRDRAAVVEDFQRPDGPSAMLISLKAGGVGLTLTAADHVYILDPWWNPAAENQAADRAHRIGQENPVLVHRLVAEGTVEERILELQQAKIALAGAVLEGGSGSGGGASLTREDLMALLR